MESKERILLTDTNWVSNARAGFFGGLTDILTSNYANLDNVWYFDFK